MFSLAPQRGAAWVAVGTCRPVSPSTVQAHVQGCPACVCRCAAWCKEDSHFCRICFGPVVCSSVRMPWEGPACVGVVCTYARASVSACLVLTVCTLMCVPACVCRACGLHSVPRAPPASGASVAAQVAPSLPPSSPCNTPRPAGGLHRLQGPLSPLELVPQILCIFLGRSHNSHHFPKQKPQQVENHSSRDPKASY